jgi:hypothetical protein
MALNISSVNVRRVDGDISIRAKITVDFFDYADFVDFSGISPIDFCLNLDLGDFWDGQDFLSEPEFIKLRN